jgi:hypothetical protein
MRRTTKLGIAASAALLLFVGSAAAQAPDGFEPTIEFHLATAKTGANPEMHVLVAQEGDQEKLETVLLKVPRGFDIASDDDTQHNELIGEGEIDVSVGPACRRDAGGNIPFKFLATVPAQLRAVDLSSEQEDRGVHAAWLLDIIVNRIPLEVTGSPRQGWEIFTEVPVNDNTCSPFELDLTVFDKGQSSGAEIFTNAKRAGRYRFSGTFTSIESDTVVTVRQVIRITR